MSRRSPFPADLFYQDETRNPFKAQAVPLEVLELELITTGDQSLRLSARVAWEQFESYAPKVVESPGGTIVARADSVPERVRGDHRRPAILDIVRRLRAGSQGCVES